MAVRYEFIINPQARSGRGRKIWDAVRAVLEEQQADYGVHFTEYQGHAEKIASEISASKDECTVAVMGGDGTVNEVLNGLDISENITLGYIPVGSSNDFARGLGIPQKPEKALRAVLNPKKILHMDVGVLSGDGRCRRFGVSAGIGFDASVCHKVSVSRWKKVLNRMHLGKLSYAAVALGRLLKDKPVRAEMYMENGEKKVFDRLFFAAFMNLPCEGGGFRFCPSAVPDDGKLDVFIADGIPKIKILFLLPLAYLGSDLDYRGITTLRCRKLKVNTGTAAVVHTDGETAAGRREIEAYVLEKKLKVIVR